jgi:flagellar FliL protein
MKKSGWVLSVIVFGLLALAGGGAGTWWLMGHPGWTPKPAGDNTRAYKYLSLEKIIVMLRKADGEAASHYLAVDLVFKTPNESEKVTREHLPLLRSVTVKALSNVTMEEASRATVDDLTRMINAAFTKVYANDRAGKPFAEAMIAKLIIE